MDFRAIVVFLCIALLYLKMLAMSTTSAAPTGDVGGSERDHIALLNFKSKINYDPQGVMRSWNNSRHFCEWQGVTCGRMHRRVTILDLHSRGLVGTLSPYIGNLSFLRELRLSNNYLQGNIPHEIGRLFRLQNLRLHNNSLEGQIPASIFRCSNLVNLTLGNNKFVGKLTEELGSLSKLELLSIGDNTLTGGIPPSIGNLTSLVSLSVSYNKFSGSIPDVFHRLKNLEKLGLGANQLLGIVPPSIYNLSHLTIFSVGENQLHGSLPPNFGLLFPHLTYLQIQINNFTGPIPHSFSNASKLEYIAMGSNNFSGRVSVDFGGMKHLHELSIFTNHLGTGGADDLKFVTSLLNCTYLEVMEITDNHFGGVMPNSIGNLSTQINFFHIADNEISGRIPSWIGALTTLATLIMSTNQFIGPIPDSLGKLQNLNKLYLANNMLSGKIPSSLGNLSSLNKLYLDNNIFQGNIPSSLGNCTSLLALGLSLNSLSGTIPKQLFNIFSLSITLRLAQNYLVGSLPVEVGNLKNLVKLDLSRNELSGEIPNSLGDCRSLQFLYMGSNFFHGAIPQSFSSLRGLEEIDLSRNNLSGKVPDYFETFFLTNLNLSFNDFEGEIPTKGVFTNVTAVSLLGNKRLCGGISELKLSSCSAKEPIKRNMSSLGIILITIACILFGVTLVSSFVYFRFKRKRNEKSSESIQTLWKASYAMLLKATDSFSIANLIGIGSFGSVYKGIIDHDEQIVAIKVLNLQRRGASKSFTAECEALRNIRHRNLVKIITSCSSVDFQGNDFKALVYEFMPNGSLERWLRPIPESSTSQVQLQILSLPQRMNIVIDVAFALDYLHNQCQPPIIHCDLKPSNILLDSDMIAHVGDFGLAKFLQEFTTPNQSSSIGIRGTIGYAPPEYGLGSEVSTTGDVYSYGILLLELITGKKPIDSMFEEGLNLHKFSSMALPDRVMEIVDPILLNDLGEAEEVCLISMVKIGVACSMESHQDRMGMKDVLRELQLIKSTLEGTPRRQNMHRGP